MTAAVSRDATVVDLTGRRPRLQVVDGVVEVPAEPGRVASWWRAARSAVVGDFDRWRLVHAEPPSLRNWLVAATPKRVPDDWRLRAAWYVDHWTTGLLLVGLSIVLFTASATTRWVACHPARRWVFLGVACTFVAWIVRA